MKKEQTVVPTAVIQFNPDGNIDVTLKDWKGVTVRAIELAGDRLFTAHTREIQKALHEQRVKDMKQENSNVTA